MKEIFGRLKSSQLAQNTLWMVIGNGVRIAFQAGYFILIARSLGAGGYGAFIGASALVAILTPFSGLGSGNLLVKNVARSVDSFGRSWGNALFLILLTGTCLLILILSVSRFVLPDSIPLGLVITIGVAELFFARFLDICGQAYQGIQRLDRTALLQTVPVVSRCIAVVGFSLVVRTPTPQSWGCWYLASTVVAAVVGLAFVHRELGSPRFDLAGIKSEMGEGFYFSISLSAQGIYNDIDKTMLARLSSLSATGIYGAAYRIIDVSFTPVRSLLFAAYARFFQHGQDGIKGSLGFARKLLPVAIGYGVVGGLILFMAAPLLPYILGPEYRETVGALRWLALLPLLKAVHYFAADTLTGAGFQKARSLVQVVVAVFNVGINFWLITNYSWRGAAWASLASDGILAFCLWIMVWRLCRTTEAVVHE